MTPLIDWQQTEGLQFLPAPDPLWHRTPTPLRARYNVLGIALEVATNAPVLARLAEEFYGDWGAPAPDAPAVRLNLFLHTAPCPSSFSLPKPVGPQHFTFRAQEGYLLVNAGESMGFGDRQGGFAVGYIAPELLDDPDRVKALFVDCLGFFLVCRYRSATLHAAAVVHRGRCVLLTGRSGAGKSTLAYACLRAGFGLLAEDIVFAVREKDAVAVWGNPWNLHLLPDAPRLFPELERAERVLQMSGETKLRVRVREVNPEAPVTHHPVWSVCSLRQSGEATSRLTDADPAGIRHALTNFKENPMLDTAAMADAADRLLQGRIAHLDVGVDLDHAVGALRHWIEN